MAGKRTTRTVEERVAELDKKIEVHKANISVLEARKKALLNPKPRKSKAAKLKELMAKLKTSGMTPEEIADKLGIEMEE